VSQSIISCRPGSYAPFVHLAYEHLAGLGVRYVEIEVPKPEELEQVQAELTGYGLSAASLQARCDVRRPDVAAQVEAQMPAFQALRVKYMFVSCKADTTPLPTVYARLRQAGDVVKRHGVTIVMETHPDLITSGDVALATMRGVDHPNVRVNFDTANIYYYNQGIDGVAELRKIAPYVGAVHLKDSDGQYRSWHFTALGRGVVKFAETIKVLQGANFSGPYTLEIEGVEGETRTERLVCDRVAESIGFLRGLGLL